MSPRKAAEPKATKSAVAAALEQGIQPVYFVRGGDPSLLRDAVLDLVDGLVGEGDRELMVQELGGDDYEIAALVDAAQTPPFLSDRRVVIGRDLHQFTSAAAVAPLVAYLADPLSTTSLVLVWESGRVPKSLSDALKSSGTVQIDPSPGRDQKSWVAGQVAESAIELDNDARTLLAKQLGEDVSRLRGILETLEATFGPGAKLSADDIRPYLGDAGSLAPWVLTDAIDSGDIQQALERLRRILGAGERHPLQVMVTLHSHYGRMLRLDGADAKSEREAADLLGLKGSTFPARKALAQLRKLGSRRLARMVVLLGQADLDLRGMKDWPPDLVMEVLVARLTALSKP